jgi:hypothetical protein
VTYDVNFAKTAADIIRDYPRVLKKNQELEEKVATLEKEKRVNLILNELHRKQASIPENYDRDLMQAPDEELSRLELALSMFTPDGSLKLGEVEDGRDGSDAAADARTDLTDLHRLLLNPASFGVNLRR